MEIPKSSGASVYVSTGLIARPTVSKLPDGTVVKKSGKPVEPTEQVAQRESRSEARLEKA